MLKTMIKNIAQELKYVTFFVFATIVLTWPTVVSLNTSISIRPDHFINLWNFWWVKTAIFNEAASFNWTDHIFYPTGIDLTRSGISLFNSVAGAFLNTFLSLNAAFNIIYLLHFTLSAWAFFLLTRYLTNNTLGSIMAGLIFTFCPFHYYYMHYLSAAAFEFIPFSVLFFLKTYRHGGFKNALLMVFCVGMLAATAHEYYLVYTFLIAVLLLLGGKLWDPRTSAFLGIRRLLLAGIPAAILVSIIYLPFILSIIGEGFTPSSNYHAHRTNNLLSYPWIGLPEFLFASWPTMLGYSTLLLIALGVRGVLKQKFWLMAGGSFLLLSMGETLKIRGIDLGPFLPYTYLKDMPIFSLLRKPDRCFLIVQFTVAILCAFSWKHVAAWFKNKRIKLLCWGICTAIIMIETTGIPFARFTYEAPSYLKNLSTSSEIQTLIHLPAAVRVYNLNGRYMFFQTFHQKKMPQGYVANLALTPENKSQITRLEQSYTDLLSGNAQPLLEELQLNNINLIIIHKTSLIGRSPFIPGKKLIWAPFFTVRHELVGCRQIGPFIEAPVPEQTIETQRNILQKKLGPPVYEDSEVLVFDANPIGQTAE